MSEGEFDGHCELEIGRGLKIDRYLFRGKCLDGSGWVCGYYLGDAMIRPSADDGYYASQHCREAVFVEELSGVVVFQVDSSTIGQCTDEKDKFGVLAFEGDIIKSDNYTGCIRFGKYKNPSDDEPHKGFYIEIMHADLEEMKFLNTVVRKDLMYWLARSEIIGNVHDPAPPAPKP